MGNEKVFASQDIGEEQAQPCEDRQKEEEDEFVDGTLQLKTNTLPQGIIDLERLFDQDLVQENIPKEHIEVEETEKINLGTDQDPRCILIGKTYQRKIREDILNAYQEYIDVIA